MSSTLEQERMGTILLPEEQLPDLDDQSVDDASAEPPKDMFCPVCGKRLRLHDPNTGQPRPLPPPGKSFQSRAICTGCRTVLYYKGNYIWGVLGEEDLSDEDRAMDKLCWDPQIGPSGTAAWRKMGWIPDKAPEE